MNPGRLQLHVEAMRVFREVLRVNQALRQQIVAAIKLKYKRALRLPRTNKITQMIPKIFEYLFQTYGDITPQDLKELMTRVENITLPPEERVNTIFAEINN